MPSWLKHVASYIVSFIIYTFILNWKVSLVLCIGVAFHECGHLYAAKMKGLTTKGFYLIPFVGGVALIADRYKNYADQFFVCLAGPVAGAFLTVVLWVVFYLTGSHFVGSAGYWMAWMNLFNLIPLAMLDGGQIAESVVYSFNETAGATFLTVSYTVGGIVLWHFSPFIAALIIFIGANAILAAWQRVKMLKAGWGSFLSLRPEKMNGKEMLVGGLSYILTTTILIGLLHSFTIASISVKDLFQ